MTGPQPDRGWRAQHAVPYRRMQLIPSIGALKDGLQRHVEGTSSHQLG